MIWRIQEQQPRLYTVLLYGLDRPFRIGPKYFCLVRKACLFQVALDRFNRSAVLVCKNDMVNAAAKRFNAQSAASGKQVQSNPSIKKWADHIENGFFHFICRRSGGIARHRL